MTVDGQGGDGERGDRRVGFNEGLPVVSSAPRNAPRGHERVRGELPCSALRRNSSVSFRVFYCFSSAFSPRTLNQRADCLLRVRN